MSLLAKQRAKKIWRTNWTKEGYLENVLWGKTEYMMKKTGNSNRVVVSLYRLPNTVFELTAAIVWENASD